MNLRVQQLLDEADEIMDMAFDLRSRGYPVDSTRFARAAAARVRAAKAIDAMDEAAKAAARGSP